MSLRITRRELLPLAGAGLLAGFAGLQSRRRRVQAPFGKSRVGVYKASSYSEDLTARILEGARACGLDMKDQKVFVAAHLEGFGSSHAINADASVVGATVRALRALGASEVTVGAGPSFERDTIGLAEAAGYGEALSDFEKIFVDLNRDDVSPVEGFPQGILYLPVTALRADLLVSVAKMKTDSQVGANLAMQNLSGIVPGSVYGWPKDTALGSGVDSQNRSLVELARVFRRSFAIVDGIVGMEGNGPLEGTPKSAGVLVMGDCLAATDATCCRIMGIDPTRIGYLAQSAGTVGNIDPAQIDRTGERPESVRTDFQLIEEHRSLRLS
jgi:uncharacterized protein (DUF362 family)